MPTGDGNDHQKRDVHRGGYDNSSPEQSASFLIASVGRDYRLEESLRVA